MHLSTLRRTARLVVGGIAAAALYVGVGIGPADAQTREHVLLARTGTSLSIELGGTSGGVDICTDWTNEDGTHGTNCPGGGGWIEILSFSFG